MKEFIRENTVFVAKGSKMDPLNQKCTIVEFIPSQLADSNDTGKVSRIMFDLDEAERLHSYLGVWLQENTLES